jgi:hypothetical protein
MILYFHSTSAPHSGQEGEVVSNETPWPRLCASPNISSNSGSYQRYCRLLHNRFGQIYRVIAGPERILPRPLGGLGDAPGEGPDRHDLLGDYERVWNASTSGWTWDAVGYPATPNPPFAGQAMDEAIGTFASRPPRASSA